MIGYMLYKKRMIDMKLEFVTKRDVNGNRYYLGIDTEAKVFSNQGGHLYDREDVVEVTQKDRRRIIDKLEESGYTKTYCIF